MAKVKQKHPNESFEQLLRRFKKAVENADIVKDARKHEYFEKPTNKRKRERAAAIKRAEKQRLKEALPPKQQRR